MKLLSAQQIHEWDAFTMQHDEIASYDLMERAAGKCTEFIMEKGLDEFPVKIFCGKGNNGGDGLVIARQLLQSGAFVTVYILEFGAKGTDDFQINLARLHELTTNIHFVQSDDFLPAIQTNDIIVDALFGSGLNRPLKDLSASVVEHINQSNARVISIDVPSGMYIDKSSKGNAVIKATYTLTFQSVKLCFLVAENSENFGQLTVLNIGLNENYLIKVQSKFQLITPELVSDIYKPRVAFSHKGNFGHALLFVGNTGKTGAAIIAAKACLRSGVGLITLNILAEYFNAVHASVPEAMCRERNSEPELKNISVVGAGPGIGTDEKSKAHLLQLLQEFKTPMVLDADALNIISENKEWLKKIPKDSIITPHPKEFERLFGKTENDFERINLTIELSQKYKIIIVLKGHHTCIAANGKGWFNSSGNAGLAKGGSGDMLTGILTALVAQQYSALHAAIFGVYIHGLAADLALESQSEESMVASDVIEYLGAAFKQIRQDQSEFKEQ